jgi:pilus assembly protein CpaB
MLNVRTLALLVVALGAAGAAAYLANSWLAGREPAVAAAAPVVLAPEPVLRILVAGKDLGAGSFLKAGDLEWRVWPKDGLLDSYVREAPEALKPFEGAVVRTPLLHGEPITTARVVHPGEQGFLAAVLDPAHRAVAVPVDATTGVGGFVQPGDRVDVILTIKPTPAEGEGGGETRYFSETLLTDLRVLAIDQTVEHAAGQAAKIGKTATLEVSPKQAEALAVGLEMGELSLSLRSVGRGPGPEPAKSYTRDTDVLFMLGDPLGLPPPASVRGKVNVLRGSEAKEMKF